MLRTAVLRAPILLGLVTTSALLAGLVHPAAAAADEATPVPLTLSVTGPATLLGGGEGALQVTLGPEGSGAEGRLHVESAPLAGGDPTVVLEADVPAGSPPVDVPVLADVSRHFTVTFTSADEARWATPGPATLDVEVAAAAADPPAADPPAADPPADDPPAADPVPVTLSVSGPGSLPYRSVGSLQVTVGPEGSGAEGRLHVESAPVAGGDPTVVLDTDIPAGSPPVDVPVVADVSHHYVVTFTSVDETRWASPAAEGVDLEVVAAATVAGVTVVGARASGVAVRAGTQVWRSFGGTATVRLTDTDGAPVSGAIVTLQQQSTDTGGAYATVRTVVTGPAGTAAIAVNPWADTMYRVVYLGADGTFLPTVSPTLLVRPGTPGLKVVPPRGAPQPAAVARPLGRGFGTGANAVVTPIPNAVWASMVGYSWNPRAHCPLGRSKLAYILVNYWGFDGNRYRGELVVAKNRAAAFARAFTTLYDAGFPIRSMVRPDRFGHSPHGWPGANDYSSMAHDNTYAFNCRYVVGRESSRRMSPHAYGNALDLNTWENPDVAANGTHPNTWFAKHRSAVYGGVIVAKGIVVKAMRAARLGWGGSSIRDYQHFDPSLL